MNNKYSKILISTFCVFFTWSCSRENETFLFKIKHATFKFDSKTGEYTRSYNSKDTSVVVALEENELRLIHKLVVDLDFEYFPYEFECHQYGTFRQPASVTTIEISIDGKVMKSTNTDLCDRKVQQKMSDNFDQIDKEICRILNSKVEIGHLPHSDVIFL